jgi:hypothetical protein
LPKLIHRFEAVSLKKGGFFFLIICMAIFHPQPKIRITQFVSIIAFGLVIPNKYFPNSGYTHAIKPFNLSIVILFFIAQAFMIYFLIQNNRNKKINSNNSN